MAYSFTNAKASLWKPGDFFLGLDQFRNEIGISTERHAITIAGSGAGKGVSLIIPNLLRWPHSALVIDPKGENAEKTWEARERLGQKVAVIDPFHVTGDVIPDRVRHSVDLLEGIDPNGMTTRADIRAIADGLVKRHDAKHGEWDEATVDIIAGIIAFIIQDAPAEHRNLASIRRVLVQPENPPPKKGKGEKPAEGLYADAERMLTYTGCGGLAKAAAVTILSAIGAESGVERGALDKAKRATAWLDETPFQKILSPGTFSLSELLTGKATLYLVLPPDYIHDYSEFLRVFVRVALSVMAKGGNNSGARCLFMLDEFFSLGRLDIVAKSAGLMRSYGVQLWPFLQDLGQLEKLYGHDGAQTFFGNADAHIFFGNTDAMTLDYISGRLDKMTAEEIGKAPVMSYHFGPEDQITPIQNENRRLAYQHRMTAVGRPRLTPNEVKELVGKPDNLLVARSMIAFGKAGAVYNVYPAPYFMNFGPPAPEPQLTDEEQESGRTFIIFCVLIGIYTAIFILGQVSDKIMAFLQGADWDAAARNAGIAAFICCTLIAWNSGNRKKDLIKLALCPIAGIAASALCIPFDLWDIFHNPNWGVIAFWLAPAPAFLLWKHYPK